MKIYGFCDTLIPAMPLTSYNSEFKWWPCDIEKNYDPENNAYGPNDITYKFNGNGFRCDSFDIRSDKRILFLGCSHTNGIGLPLEHTWPHILLNYIKKETGHNIPFWNLATGGTGLDTQTRMFYHYGLKLKPQLVFAYFPAYRRELYNADDRWLSPFNSSHPETNFDNIPYYADPRIQYYEIEKNMCFLDVMLKTINATMIHNYWAMDGEIIPIYDRFQINHKFQLTWDKKARDKLHCGHSSHINFAKNIWETYKDIIVEKLSD